MAAWFGTVGSRQRYHGLDRHSEHARQSRRLLHDAWPRVAHRHDVELAVAGERRPDVPQRLRLRCRARRDRGLRCRRSRDAGGSREDSGTAVHELRERRRPAAARASACCARWSARVRSTRKARALFEKAIADFKAAGAIVIDPVSTGLELAESQASRVRRASSAPRRSTRTSRACRRRRRSAASPR